MAYNPMMGLLDEQQSLAPNLGLLGRLGNPGASPAMQALGQMAMGTQSGGGPYGGAVRAPGAPPAPGGPPVPPSPGSGSQTPPAEPPPRPAPATRRPLVTPTQMGLLTAGQELSTNDAPTLAHAVSRALAAGVPAFLTSKQAERDQADAAASEVDWRNKVDALPISAARRAILRAMPRASGEEVLKSLSTQQVDPLSSEGVIAQTTLAKNKAEIEDMYRPPANIDPLSPEGIRAQTGLLETRLNLEAALRERNIDPLSPEGLAAQKELLRYKQAITPDKDGTREPPLAIVTALRGNEGAIEKMNQAIRALENNPDATSIWRNVPGIGPLQDMFGREDNIVARGVVEGAGLATVYDESGKQINRYELQERGDIPRPRDRADVALGKLIRLRDNAIRANSFLRDAYSERFGFREIPQRDPDPAAGGGAGGGAGDMAQRPGETVEAWAARLARGGRP